MCEFTLEKHKLVLRKHLPERNVMLRKQRAGEAWR
jgi:hypothetical protein